MGQQKTPFNVFHGLSAHSTAVMQRLDRKLGCRIAEQIINQACSLLHRRRESLVPQDVKSLLPQENEVSRINHHIASVIS